MTWLAEHGWLILAVLAAAGALVLLDIFILRRRSWPLTDEELRRLNKWIRDAHTDVH